MLSFIKKTITSVVDRIADFQSNRFSERREKRLLTGITNTLHMGGGGYQADNERIWYTYWKPLVKHRSIWAYRLYSHFCGHSRDILSQPIANAINRALNPGEHQAYYSDKNSFDKLLPAGVLPKTIIRVIDGLLMDADYNAIEGLTDSELQAYVAPYKRIIIKPTVETSSGNGVRLINLDGNTGATLTVGMVRKSGKNVIVQEALTQSDFMAQFNTTSVNTIRIATYKSPYTGQVHILSAVIRMGAPGAVVDNMHQNGHMIRVDEKNGKLADHCFDADGIASKKHGDVDFSKQSFTVPDWTAIIDFARKTAGSITHMKLLQLDIAIDSENNPRLLEFNTEGFAMWVAQFTGTPALREHTDEIRKYALAQKHSIKIIQTRH